MEEISDTLGKHTGLHYNTPTGEAQWWKTSDLKSGTQLNQPGPLFKKLEEKILQ